MDIAVAFRTHAAELEGKHPIPAADLDAAEAVGTWLLRNLKPRGVRPMKGAPADAIDLRNCVATLVVRDYEQGTMVAHWFLGASYLEVAPPLLSRFVPRKATPVEGPTPPATPPAPVAPPAPAPAAPPAPVVAAPPNGAVTPTSTPHA